MSRQSTFVFSAKSGLPARARTAVAGLWLFGLVACATESGLTTNTVVLHTEPVAKVGSSKAVTAYYETVFARMRDAAREGGAEGLEELRYLLQQHNHDRAVGSAKTQLEQFALLADGLAFEVELPDLCNLVCETEGGAATTSQRFEFSIRQPGDRVLELRGSGSRPVMFRAVANVRDFDASGQFVDMESSVSLPVGETKRLTGGAELKLPFAIPGAASTAAIRELAIRIEVLPGVVVVDGQELPVGRPAGPRLSKAEMRKLSPSQRLKMNRKGYTRCAEYTALLYPAGFESIKKAPLVTLREAQRRGDAKFFKHTFLAAHFMPEKDREAALAVLIRHVRNGTPTQAQVAMGALRVLSGNDIPISDRRAWLKWWQRHREERSK